MPQPPRPKVYADFGSRLRSLILQRDASIKAFIRRSGLNKRVYQYVSGMEYPNQDVITTICEALGCSVEDLMDPVVPDTELSAEKKAENVYVGRKKRGRPFQPGGAGNPEGHKRSREEKEIVTSVQSLLPGSVERLESFLDSPDTGAMAKVRICRLILNRTYGKQKPAKKKASENETLEQSLNYVRKLAAQAAGDGKEPV